jgi:hypothetical protein
MLVNAFRDTLLAAFREILMAAFGDILVAAFRDILVAFQRTSCGPLTGPSRKTVKQSHLQLICAFRDNLVGHLANHFHNHLLDLLQFSYLIKYKPFLPGGGSAELCSCILQATVIDRNTIIFRFCSLDKKMKMSLTQALIVVQTVLIFFFAGHPGLSNRIGFKLVIFSMGHYYYIINICTYFIIHTTYFISISLNFPVFTYVFLNFPVSAFVSLRLSVSTSVSVYLLLSTFVFQFVSVSTSLSLQLFVFCLCLCIFKISMSQALYRCIFLSVPVCDLSLFILSLSKSQIIELRWTPD